ncbi:ABC transporter substrate-binding protein [Chryseobacterium viscerum]|uniref:ABC transporter substrate-binding protein n=1 Tax=Chryseobacterium viscerum TaxID=1037377 RepID=UPI002221485F|nr:ABC transporter substrate-binding protein [Chryseobacterium viscerum]MCW1961271.1 ABC transporter substrate-binding protein [Chryseobacterium viscerum]
MKKSIFLLILLISIISCRTDNTTIETDFDNAENKEIELLYNQAQKEGNEITVWGGGDDPGELNWIKSEWEKDFPKIKMNIRVDLSKFLDVEIDDQLTNNNLTPDIVHIQTLHDFYRWKNQGVLENFKPVQWDKIPDDIKDQDGAFTPVFMVTFAMLVNRNKVNSTPKSYTDILQPAYKDNLMLTYPHDDDAVLYLYKKIVDQYGWDFIDKLIQQNPKWIRGTAAPAYQVAKGNVLGTIGAAGVFDKSKDSNAEVVLPVKDPFLTWAQTSAIFKISKHKAAAKLYMTWLLSKKIQSIWSEWSVRTDMPNKSGYPSYRNYPNTSPTDFTKFMLDRSSVESFSKAMEAKIGPIKGGSPLTDPDILELLK